MKLSFTTAWLATARTRVATLYSAAQNKAAQVKAGAKKVVTAVRSAPKATRSFLHAALIAPAQTERAAKRIARASMIMMLGGMAIFAGGAAFAIIGPMGALVAIETATAVGFITVGIGAPLMITGILQEDRAGPVAYGQPFTPPRVVVPAAVKAVVAPVETAPDAGKDFAAAAPAVEAAASEQAVPAAKAAKSAKDAKPKAA